MSTQRIINVNGLTYVVSDDESKLLKRGILDPYDASKEPNEWVVLKEYVFWSHDLKKAIIIPRWFITDLASVPQLFRAFISVNERHRLASLPHDLLYAMSSTPDFTTTRKTADKVLLTFCKVMGVPKWKRWLIYSAVRVGGWIRFGKKGKRVFIPSSHRLFYLKNFPELNLDLADCEHQEIKK